MQETTTQLKRKQTNPEAITQERRISRSLPSLQKQQKLHNKQTKNN